MASFSIFVCRSNVYQRSEMWIFQTDEAFSSSSKFTIFVPLLKSSCFLYWFIYLCGCFYFSAHSFSYNFESHLFSWIPFALSVILILLIMLIFFLSLSIISRNCANLIHHRKCSALKFNIRCVLIIIPLFFVAFLNFRFIKIAPLSYILGVLYHHYLRDRLSISIVKENESFTVNLSFIYLCILE